MNRIYLDNAATTCMAEEVIQEMQTIMRDCFGNPSSIHGHGRQARAYLEKARRQVAELVGAAPAEICFTSGGTEADNMALRKTVEVMGIKHIISSPIEHHAVTHTIEALEAEGKVKVDWIPHDRLGRLNMESLEKHLAQSDKALVSLMHANNEIGTTIDLHAVGQLCRQYGALFHSDTVQTMGHFPFDLKSMPVDMVTCSAHKLHGPKGVGFLYIDHDRVKLAPFITGGAQERNLRAGTENLYGIAGLAKALSLAVEGMDEHASRIRSLKRRMLEGLQNEFPGLECNGVTDGTDLYTVLNVSFPETPDAEMFLMKMDIHGISASGGSACSSGAQTGSHVLAHIGAPVGRPGVRFSFSRYTTEEEIERSLAILNSIWKGKAQTA